MYLLFSFAFLMLLGNLYVSLGYVQEHGENFWIVSSSIGAGYGAVFCLAPTVVSVVWGTQNFGTNWGIVTMTPAAGAMVFGSIFHCDVESFGAFVPSQELHEQFRTLNN
ncbi:hypothetical protein B9Z19DRAFT_1130122 [Tuber borchii]|uniref:Major facilitator superfamily domain-containing protein n=1 Tax=Tuber borchii TaxID=42251 RepID=A0A2T6ZL14_TUBBO|nr:hypothetical protein B9Z19DRAFT_1130122 [Tuber borchii]